MSWRAGGDGKGIQIPADVWERVFGKGALQARGIHPFALAPDDETVDVVAPGGKVQETTTVGSLRERGALMPYQGKVTTSYDPPLRG